jgi:hypothetical protein
LVSARLFWPRARGRGSVRHERPGGVSTLDVDGLENILLIAPSAAEVALWSRDPDRNGPGGPR